MTEEQDFFALLETAGSKLLVTVSVLVENLKGDDETAAAAATLGEVSERSADVVEELVALRHLWLPTPATTPPEAAAAAAAAAVSTGTTSTLPPLVTPADAAEELDVPLPVSAPSSSASLLSESEESPVKGTERICPARYRTRRQIDPTFILHCPLYLLLSLTRIRAR